MLIAVVGPTAVGKSALAMKIARELKTEIVSLDAYQIYQGMDIGTAKPTLADIEEIPHRLINKVSIDFAVSVQQFTRWACDDIEELESRGQIPIAVGGSGLYLRSVLDQLQFPPTDASVRIKYLELLEEVGEIRLHELLKQIDPAAAEVISHANVRRVIRALEVNEITGKPFRAKLPAPNPRYWDVRIGLRIGRSELAERIRTRVTEMFAAGWPTEVEKLAAEGLFRTSTASRALGYDTVHLYVQGKLSYAEAVEAVTAATVRFAKRQMQWFQRDERVQWLDFDDSRILEKSLSIISTAAEREMD